MKTLTLFCLTLLFANQALAQRAPYDDAPDARPPYYRIRYEASRQDGELAFAAQYTAWIPENIQRLRGVVVHQHGCGEGSCRSGMTGAFDLHWQALAAAHDCALLAPVYEQPQEANCQLWCDPRNGSSSAFVRALSDLGAISGHPELADVPWALWGHSGGGHWCGGMTLMHPERVASAWLRSGVPMFDALPSRPTIAPHDGPNPQVLQVPVMCNPGTKEGVTDTSNKFSRVWPAVLAFHAKLRKEDGLVGIAVDPLTSHECGNQRYLAIPWLDVCLQQRLPETPGSPLRPMARSQAWLAGLSSTQATPADEFAGDRSQSIWLPNASFAKLWTQYVTNTKVADTTPPPAPTNVKSVDGRITWRAKADRESGLSHFIIRRDGEFHARVPENGKNRFGRPIFQGLQYSDTPTQPLVKMEFLDPDPDSSASHSYQVIAVNTLGLESAPASQQHQ
ncbi:MAG: hypothetical protein AAGD07_04275 [Planctomycetota bacterium]